MKLPAEPVMHRNHGAVDIADQAVAERDGRDFPVAADLDARQQVKTGNADSFASRLLAQRRVGVADCGRHARGVSPRRLAMIRSITRFGSTAASRWRIASGAMW